MTAIDAMERNIARCRLVLSVTAAVALYVDPAEPLLTRWVAVASGAFVIDPMLLLVMATHLTYSVIVYWVLSRRLAAGERVAQVTTWTDVAFGAAIAALTEGATSPSYLFFAFAVVNTGLRHGLRQAIIVTTACVAAYEALLVVWGRAGAEVYLMRPVYLAITGYLVGYLGQQRLEMEKEMHTLEVAERQRIGRELHDNFTQALAGINLHLEACCRRLRANPNAEMLGSLTELQDSVQREYMQLRSFTRFLAGLEMTAPRVGAEVPPRLRVRADLTGSPNLVDHVLQIAREGIANVRRHAHASNAAIDIRCARGRVEVGIDDDGVGFQTETPPWSIASRVSELGGDVEIVGDRGPGAHLLVRLPQD